ncbi:metal ABC transporter substrate-binding protein [Demetria terragena]|uniref:metal ABC transporter substrate-binding protein n=1 Tax=Demetria terragena TaxID=63959 RepID=UPI00035CC070|nr:metal ABC transporter substrate-binding protein [Demetria terragena]
MRPPVSAALTAALLMGVTACGSDTSNSDGASGEAGGDTVEVLTSFYPLEFAVSEIGGKRVSASNLVKPGTDPHDLELSPKDVAKVSETDLFVYLKGFAGPIDDAAKNQGSDHAYDVSTSAELDLSAPPEGGDHEGHDHGEEDHDHGPNDPHFWLDPVRYAKVATAIGDRLAKADPDHAAEYRANAKKFGSKLTSLNKDLTTRLANCKRQDLITGHAAFGYLAQRVGMTQVPISGVSPKESPDAKTLTKISTLAKESGATVIYTETLASPRFAEAVARSSGAKTAVLDPLEGITSKSPGSDYFEVMRANIKTLEKGQACS